MLLYACAECGRVGAVETPDSMDKVTCAYCGDADIDWIARPDLDGDNISVLARAERAALMALDHIYEVYDFVGMDEGKKEDTLQAMIKLLEKET